MNTWEKGLLLAVAGTMLGMAIPTQAATIDAKKMNDGYFISIEGNINWADGATLANVIKKNHITNGEVFLNSGGGLTVPGLEIANIIKDKGFETHVASGDRCYSMCAIMWLSGKTRHVGRAAVIGFHGISNN